MSLAVAGYPATAMPGVLLATTGSVPGATIVRTLGYVADDGRSHIDPIDGLRASIEKMGANAVVGLRWTESDGAGRPMVYGTAVMIESVDG